MKKTGCLNALFKSRLAIILCLGLFLPLDKFAGRYLFGEAQIVVEILFIFVTGVSVFYFAIRNEILSHQYGPKVDKRKRALLRLLRMKESAKKLK